MKNLTIVIMMLTLSLHAFASKDRGGGDECERRIQSIRLDIKDWILNGGAEGLNLPEGLELEDYEDGMLQAIDDATIQCTTDKIMVFGAEKTCVNESQDMSCNISRFMKFTSEGEQYRLIHHEYAGLAGFETNNGEPESNYEISDQVTGFLEQETVLRLKIKKPSTGYLNFCNRGTLGFRMLAILGESDCSKVDKKLVSSIEELDLSGSYEGEHKRVSKEILSGTFVGFDSLKFLNLAYNEISEIQPGAFEGLKSIKSISLQANELVHVEEDMFGGLETLEGLSLNDNQIESIDRNAFRGSDLISDLDIYNNNISMLPEGLLKSLSSLAYISISGNEIERMSDIDVAGSKTIETIRISSNALTKIEKDDFEGMIRLEQIYINGNNIESFADGVFSDLVSLRVIFANGFEESSLDKELLGISDDVAVVYN